MTNFKDPKVIPGCEHKVSDFDIRIIGSAAEVRRYRARDAAWEAERLAMAKQIHDLNLRLTYDATASERIAELTQLLSAEQKRRQEQELRYAAEATKDRNQLREQGERLAIALRRVQNLEADTHEASVRQYVDSEAVEEALTEVIRAAKAIRRRWRGE